MGRRFARERHYRFLRANLWLFIASAVGGCALSLTMLLLPDRLGSARAFLVGLIAAGWLSWLWNYTAVASGAAASSMGEAAEQWTDQELRVLRSAGWRVVNHISLKFGDVDHVAIGPDGLLVLETKWRSNDCSVSPPDSWMVDAAHSTHDETRRIRGVIGWGKASFPDPPVVTMVVVWGPSIKDADQTPVQVDDGVFVVSGAALGTALSAFTAPTTSPPEVVEDEVENAYDLLIAQAKASDNGELSRLGAAPRAMSEIAQDWLGVALVGIASMLVSVAALTWLGFWGYLAATAVALASGLYGLRSDRLRAHILAGLAGWGIFAVTVVAWAAFHWRAW